MSLSTVLITAAAGSGCPRSFWSGTNPVRRVRGRAARRRARGGGAPPRHRGWAAWPPSTTKYGSVCSSGIRGACRGPFPTLGRPGGDSNLPRGAAPERPSSARSDTSMPSTIIAPSGAKIFHSYRAKPLCSSTPLVMSTRAPGRRSRNPEIRSSIASRPWNLPRGPPVQRCPSEPSPADVVVQGRPVRSKLGRSSPAPRPSTSLHSPDAYCRLRSAPETSCHAADRAA
jgi:hypothetical protein